MPNRFLKVILIIEIILGFFFLAPVDMQTIHYPCPQGQAEGSISWYNSLGCNMFGIGVTYGSGQFSNCIGKFVSVLVSC